MQGSNSCLSSKVYCIINLWNYVYGREPCKYIDNVLKPLYSTILLQHVIQDQVLKTYVYCMAKLSV